VRWIELVEFYLEPPQAHLEPALKRIWWANTRIWYENILRIPTKNFLDFSDVYI